MVKHPMKADWRFATATTGVLCVMINLTQWKLPLSVESLDSRMKVSLLHPCAHNTNTGESI